MVDPVTLRKGEGPPRLGYLPQSLCPSRPVQKIAAGRRDGIGRQRTTLCYNTWLNQYIVPKWGNRPLQQLEAAGFEASWHYFRCEDEAADSKETA
jgi:hypothetical protein